jgi:coenzyme F420-dependent glucose-6-phosphate dehydrogenase
MATIGYALSSEEHGALDLVRNAVEAEKAGFSFAGISDHYHPWINEQGHSPFVWSVLGGIAASTDNLRLLTAVTCPTIRIHPAIIAHAAATTACLMPGRFWLGLGSGENLNEHVTGAGWPPADIRLDMLEEAISIIRELWTGQNTDYLGQYYNVENARIYDVPDPLPPIYIAAAGEKAAQLAGSAGEGLISTSPKPDLVEEYRAAGGDGPRIGQVAVCVAESEAKGLDTVMKVWPNSALKGSFKQELALPAHFEEVTSMVKREDVAEAVVCGSDPSKHIEAIEKFVEGGFDHVYIHQIGRDQKSFFDFYAREVLPHFQQEGSSDGSGRSGRPGAVQSGQRRG